jgi:internalin A
LQRIEEEQRYGMKEINLAQLGLTEIPPELWQLTDLEHLYLYGNALTSLPPEIATLTKLRQLDLSANQLTHIPPEIGQLTQLDRLFVANNQLTQLPPEIGNLVFLDMFSVKGNQLTSLPPEIGKLKNLCDLDIRQNQLRHLPNELGGILAPMITCVEPMIWLEHNPLITPPPEVLAQWTPGILAYLREQAAYHTRQMLMDAAGGVGIIAGVGLLVYRYRRRGRRKSKRAKMT